MFDDLYLYRFVFGFGILGALRFLWTAGMRYYRYDRDKVAEGLQIALDPVTTNEMPLARLRSLRRTQEVDNNLTLRFFFTHVTVAEILVVTAMAACFVFAFFATLKVATVLKLSDTQVFLFGLVAIVTYLASSLYYHHVLKMSRVFQVKDLEKLLW